MLGLNSIRVIIMFSVPVVIAIVLLGIWLLGLIFRIAGKIIHILLVAGIILLAIHLISGSLKALIK